MRPPRSGLAGTAALGHSRAMASIPDELQIRMRRAAFNRALAEGDLAAIRPILAPGVVLVTGTDSDIAFDTDSISDWRCASVVDENPEARSSSGLAFIISTSDWRSWSTLARSAFSSSATSNSAFA